MTISERAHEDRLKLVRESRADAALTPINGIDFIEIDPADPTTLVVSFAFDVDTVVDPHLPTAIGSALALSDFAILGGERIATIAVTKIRRVERDRIAVTVAPEGDLSVYTLRIGQSATAPRGFDPMLCRAQFIFHVECAKRFDCKQTTICPAPHVPPPPIDYLAKDYPSFVAVMLDRLALLAPRWSERHAADLGVMVVEVLGYVADQLSYRHDVVDTEAYIELARLRTSVRRHARLVDYRIGDGSNARVWLVVKLANDLLTGVPAGTRCCTGYDGARVPDLAPTAAAYTAAIDAGAQFFEVVADRFDTSEPPKPIPRALYANNNAMPLYSWSARETCLPIGGTSATLNGTFTLRRGDFLILAEIAGAQTGDIADVDPRHRHAVRLIADAEHDVDPLYGNAQPTTRIAWHPDDALPFALCVANAGRCSSAAYGNVILADHGRTLGSPHVAPLEAMPERLAPAPADSRFRPHLAKAPLTFAAANPYTNDRLGDPHDMPMSARAASSWGSAQTLPAVWLQSTDTAGNPLLWTPSGDLFDASASTTQFVAEAENDGTVFLRFGDGSNGLAASTEMTFDARYRMGNGTAGNVGRETIALIDRTFPGGGFIDAVHNPLAAFGGVDPETIEHVRQNAPVAFRTQERCVTPQDYADRAMRMPGVARAAATFRWTGSWSTMFVTIEREANVPLDSSFKTAVKAYLERYRMAGIDLEVEDAIRVPLLVAMRVCVRPEYVAADVERALLAVFASGMHFTMGQPFFLSPLVAAAQEVDGVLSVRVDAFRRESDPSGDAIDAGVIVPQRLELFELANDPNYPERGSFSLVVEGGR